MERLRRFLLSMTLILASTALYAQSEITGTVVDETGEGVIGATIKEKGTSNGKDNVDENTVWTGYFWMDDWSTLEVAKTSFDGINWNDYKAIRFYSEANRTDYVINVLTKWDEGGKLGDQTTMTMTNEYAELSLEGMDMAARLDTDRLMVQCNKEGGNPFNFTAIVLVKKDVDTGVADIRSQKQDARSEYFNIAGQRTVNPSKGLYIVNGKMVFIK